MLEPDIPSPNRRSSRQPTDIADIIADSVGAEQRYNPVFHPNSGPYGRFPSPPANPVPSGRSRRPSSIGHSSGNRNLQRSPYTSQFEFVDDNSLLGSGNFDVLGGGVFRESGDYNRPYSNNNNNNNYYPPAPPAHDNFRPHQQFYPLEQPPSQQLGNFGPQQPPAQHPPSNNNYNVPSYPTSFFDDDFFSNFRDFADVNQDYRN